MSQPQSRREMCRDALRYVALGGIGLLSAGLIGRRIGGTDATRCPLAGAAGDVSAGAAVDVSAGAAVDVSAGAAVELPPQRSALPAQQSSACGRCAALTHCQLPPAVAARNRSEG